MIVKTPSLWHVLATQISAAQTPSLNNGFKELMPSSDDILRLSLFSGFNVNMQDEMVVI